jgi:hydrogenase maturation protease
MHEAVRAGHGGGRDDRTLVLGLGNVLWADEGFGVRAVEALNAGYAFADNVRLMDGGTQGIYLLPWVQSADRLLILDAVDYGMAPGTLRLIRDDDVPRYMGVRKVSMHQAGFQEVLASARLTGQLPRHIALVGVQPELLDDYGGSLRPCVRACIPEAIEMALAVLEAWGTPGRRRASPLPDGAGISPGELEIGIYESGRPRLGGVT